MTYKETLGQVRTLLTPESAWTQEITAVDKYDQLCDTRSDDAVSWCLLGAIEKVNKEEFWPITSYLSREIGSVTAWNDHPERTHQEVLDMLDKQIATC